MALNTGNAECTTGLSKRLYDNWTTDSGHDPNRSGLVSPLEGSADDCVKALCHAIAKAVVDEINANL